EHRRADLADLTAAAALRAGDRLRARLRAGPATRVAHHERGERDLLLCAVDGLVEGQLQVIAQVGSGRWPPPSRAGSLPGGPTEERVEDVAEALESAERAARSLLSVAAQTGLAEHVVCLPALRVGQDLVGLVDLLEPLGRVRRRVDVGMPLLGQAAERALDVL